MRRWDSKSVPLPPMPDDPSVCRWCTGPKTKNFLNAPICQAGCAPDNVTTSGPRKCSDCERTFQTGERFPGDQCWECARGERARAVDGGRPITGYQRDRTRLGAVARDKREGRI